MSYRDFLKYFDRVELCNLSPDSLSEEQQSRGKKKWEMSTFEGEWASGVSAGGCRNYLGIVKPFPPLPSQLNNNFDSHRNLLAQSTIYCDVGRSR
jgi:hypothetical protein